MSTIATPLRVGLVVLAAAGAFAIGLSFIGGNRFGRDSSYRVYAMFDDATGLGVRSRAQIAGIPIGQVDRIELDQQRSLAKVWLRINKDVQLHADATVTKRSESILGDFLLDMSPGSPDQPLLKEGDEIKNVIRPPGINEVFNQLSKIASDIQAITHSLRGVIASEEGETSLKAVVANLKIISESLKDAIQGSGKRLDDMLANFQGFSADLKKLSSGESDDIVAILKNTRDATAEARNILRTVSEVVGSAKEGELKESISGIRGTLEKLDRTITNVESVTRKIDQGQGTVGRLVNDDKLIKNLENASRDISHLVGRADELKIDITERSEFLFGKPGATNPLPGAHNAYNPWAKNYFTIKIAPKPDKWYGIELVDDPRGVTRLVDVRNTVIDNGVATCPGGGTTFFPCRVQTITTDRQLKFSGYIAKRFGPISGRFGILENTGGFGIKAHLLKDDLTLSADFFEFANPLKEHPRVKLYADYRFLGHILVTAGIDDLVNTPLSEDPLQPTRITSGRDYFVGAGFYFTDEDLKLVISAIGLRF